MQHYENKCRTSSINHIVSFNKDEIKQIKFVLTALKERLPPGEYLRPLKIHQY